MRYLILFYKLNLFINTTRLYKISARNIYRNWNNRNALFFPALNIPANLVQYKKIKLGNKAVFFKKRNKLIRSHKSVFFMIPADKSFGANNFSCNGFVLWLVVNTEFVLLQSAFHCLYDVLFVQKLLLKFIFKKGYILAINSFNFADCQKGPVAANYKRQVMTDWGIDSHLYNLMRNWCCVQNYFTD